MSDLPGWLGFGAEEGGDENLAEKCRQLEEKLTATFVPAES